MKSWHWFAIDESIKGKQKMMKADFFFNKRKPQTGQAQQKPKRHTPKANPSSNVVSFADYAKSRKQSNRYGA